MGFIVLVAPENRSCNKIKFLKLLELVLDSANAHFIAGGGIGREERWIAELRNNHHLRRIIAADLLEPGSEIFFAAAPRSEISVHHDEVHIVGGFCLRIRTPRDIVIGVADEAAGIE